MHIHTCTCLNSIYIICIYVYIYMYIYIYIYIYIYTYLYMISGWGHLEKRSPSKCGRNPGRRCVSGAPLCCAVLGVRPIHIGGIRPIRNPGSRNRIRGLPFIWGQLTLKTKGLLGLNAHMLDYCLTSCLVGLHNLLPLIRKPPNKKPPLGGNKYCYNQFRRRHAFPPHTKRCLIRSTPLIRNPPNETTPWGEHICYYQFRRRHDFPLINNYIWSNSEQHVGLLLTDKT